MPEMPEVEQVKKTLAPHVIVRKIEAIDVRLGRLIKYHSLKKFVSGLLGKIILDVGRNGKYLVLKTGAKQQLVIHLRMTGALIAQSSTLPAPDYAKIKFELSGGVTMWFTDIRTFGTLYLVTDGDIFIEGYETLCPEPLSSGFTVKYLQMHASKSRKAIKCSLPDLMDIQSNAIMEREGEQKWEIEKARLRRVMKKHSRREPSSW
ncbi:MAG: hypothetical protein LUD41_06745 [Phascolarctobacterium sp.]|nr:hypothetical protein [Phascolarctobacterium sp.]